MADAQRVSQRPLAGRDDEVSAVLGLFEAAAAGQAGALMISGEAGVGKTALVRAGCAEAAEDIDVLWGACLPLASLAVPFLPLRSALRDWADGRGLAVPLSGLADPGGSGDWPVQFDAWLDGLCQQGAVALMVDDLHWADQSSLDALMYVLAGAPRRGLAVVVTMRVDEVVVGHPLHRWLADVRRLPGVIELHLGRLDRVATHEQVAGLLGRPPHHTLVDDVFARANGNAYLTRLLVRDLPPDATSLPPDLPIDLREAVARTWHGLSPQARDLTGLVAVARQPEWADRLGQVADATGVDGDVVPPLREAVDAGVLEVRANGSYWFVHPLLAEILEEELLPEERRRRHAAFAAALDRELAPGRDAPIERVVGLADHHFLAGQPTEAYRWALLAADAADRVGGAAEMLRLLRRALGLRPQVCDAGVSALDLLTRIRGAAERAGALQEELAAIEDLLAMLDRGQQPLLVAELLVRRTQLRSWTGREFFALGEVREAVELSARHPDSAEHALATAELAHAELWHGEQSGPERAQHAVLLARASGSARALAYALTANVMRAIINGEEGLLAEAEEAQSAAVKVGDFGGFVHATLWAGNTFGGVTAQDAIELTRRSREQMTTLGAPHFYVAWLSATEAFRLLFLGDRQACEERLRVVLGSSPGPTGDTMARLTAALLAEWQGRHAEAEAHLARAEEVFAEHSGFLAFPFDAVRAELAVAAGDTERAITAALTGLAGEGECPTLVERLIPLAARAAADQAQGLRDHGEDPGRAVTTLRDLKDQYPTIVADTGIVTPGDRALVHAMQAWYDAELLRGRLDPAAATAWTRAAQAAAAAGLAWDETYAQWRTAEELFRQRSARDEAVAALRRAHELAVQLEAEPLRTKVEALARTGRVSLATVPSSPRAEMADALPGLTPREREVLGYVVAGRTYGEIARELVISEKTVSVHVSNLLHKTGTSGRVELAQLVGRLDRSTSH